MPMCDMYIQEGALESEAEQALVARVSDLLVEHEIRRIVDLVDDPATAAASVARGKSIAWVFVHRTDTFVAGSAVGPDAPRGPVYKFDVKIPEGQIDDEFIPAINRDILEALTEAEHGRWKHPELRLWVFVSEVKDGTWGAAGYPLSLEAIVDYVAPGLGRLAVKRWEARKLAESATLSTSASATASSPVS